MMQMTLLLLAGIAMQPAPAVTPPDTFCARLAPKLGLSLRKSADGDFWQINTLNPVQRLVIGGSTMMSFGAEPVGAYTQAEVARAAKMCGIDKKSIVCNVVGPVTITALAGDQPVKADARAGERARLWTAGTRVRCQDLTPG